MPLPSPILGTCLTTQACALTGNRTSDPLVLRPVLNPLSHTSQGTTCTFDQLAPNWRVPRTHSGLKICHNSPNSKKHYTYNYSFIIKDQLKTSQTNRCRGRSLRGLSPSQHTCCSSARTLQGAWHPGRLLEFRH